MKRSLRKHDEHLPPHQNYEFIYTLLIIYKGPEGRGGDGESHIVLRLFVCPSVDQERRSLSLSTAGSLRKRRIPRLRRQERERDERMAVK